MDIKFVFAQGVLAGKSSASEKKCLEDQLRDAKAAVRDAESGLKQLATKIKYSEKELKEIGSAYLRLLSVTLLVQRFYHLILVMVSAARM